MSTAKEYHEATKYSPETISRHPGLDWSTQPKPFKTFRSNERYSLAEMLLVGRDESNGRPILNRPEDPFTSICLEQLSTLLLHSYGITAVAKTPGGDHFFRAAPSAGALYPAEFYLATTGVEGLPDGIYDYQTQNHSLAPVLEGDYSGEIRALCPASSFSETTRCFLILSCVYYRSSWRYHDRAYRRILLDTGHALGNVAMAAEELDLATSFAAGFDDKGLNSMLWLDDSQEAVLAVVGLDLGRGAYSTVTASADKIQSEETDPSILRQLHRAGYPSATTSEALRYDPDPETQAILGGATVPLSRKAFNWNDPVCESLLLRRSTRHFGGGPIPLQEFSMMLEFAYRPQREQAHRNPLFAPLALDNYLCIQKVTGIEAGVYRFDPLKHELQVVSLGDFSAATHAIALGQELARDAAAILFHTATLDRVVEVFGDRGYRYLSLDAGHIGQRLNIAAVRMGLGASGIGGYYDDQANTLLELDANEAIIYMTCLGQPFHEF